jgi:RNA polymerase sigma factor (sigma-70 family)
LKLNKPQDQTKLWQAFKKGDKLAYEEIYRSNFYDLKHYGISICHDEAMALDAIHNLFFDLWTRKAQLGDTDNIRFYLLKGLRRLITRQLNRQRKMPYLTLPEVEISHEARIIEDQAREETSLELKQALLQLSPRQREVVFLKFYEELSYEEIAAITSLKVRTVYNTVFQALESIRHLMSQRAKWIILIIGIFLP